ncbi:MAG: hypothetical protein JXA64_09455 [Candidatus Fermentibacteraceae bacterium]|nr:hypothetical protein [Candidatus Fermentibacteraceae bacterium]MBN2609325.1 hypothetical protein [Candidatus Fermentibacteraceae bacterium]
MRSAFLVALLILCFCSVSHAGDLGELTPAEGADGWKTVEMEGASLSWIGNEDSFSFRLEAPSTGWVAVGFGGGPAMKDASLIMGYADDDGAHYRDDHGTSPVSHSPDIDNNGADDILEADVQEYGDSTVFTFTLPVEPSDDLDPVLSPGDAIRILVAWGGGDGFSGMHREALSARIEL